MCCLLVSTFFFLWKVAYSGLCNFSSTLEVFPVSSLGINSGWMIALRGGKKKLLLFLPTQVLCLSWMSLVFAASTDTSQSTRIIQRILGSCCWGQTAWHGFSSWTFIHHGKTRRHCGVGSLLGVGVFLVGNCLVCEESNCFRPCICWWIFVDIACLRLLGEKAESTSPSVHLPAVSECNIFWATERINQLEYLRTRTLCSWTRPNVNLGYVRRPFALWRLSYTSWLGGRQDCCPRLWTLVLCVCVTARKTLRWLLGHHAGKRAIVSTCLN